MKFYTVYEVKNKVNDKTYRGKHITDNPYDGYLGSGKYLKRAINKYGIESFEKFVLYIFDNKEDMDKKEAELVDEVYLLSGNTYNLKLGGQGGFDHIYSSPEIATEVGKRGYNAGLAKFTKEKRSEIGKKSYSKSLLLFRKSNDPEIKKRRSEISGNTFRGKHHTSETKKKMSEKQQNVDRTGNNNPMYGKCWVYNDKESIRIDKTDLDIYLQNGWIKGRKYKLHFI